MVAHSRPTHPGIASPVWRPTFIPTEEYRRLMGLYESWAAHQSGLSQEAEINPEKRRIVFGRPIDSDALLSLVKVFAAEPPLSITALRGVSGDFAPATGYNVEVNRETGATFITVNRDPLSEEERDFAPLWLNAVIESWIPYHPGAPEPAVRAEPCALVFDNDHSILDAAALSNLVDLLRERGQPLLLCGALVSLSAEASAIDAMEQAVFESGWWFLALARQAPNADEITSVIRTYWRSVYFERIDNPADPLLLGRIPPSQRRQLLEHYLKRLDAEGNLGDPPIERVVTMSNEATSHRWTAKSVNVDFDAGSLVITDQANKPHNFPIDKIRDLYFRPMDEDPERLVLTIWNRPRGRRNPEVSEAFAGVFVENDLPIKQIDEIVRKYRLNR